MMKKSKTDYDKIYEKAHKAGESYCRVCGRDLFLSDPGVCYTTTHRKSICLFHLECALKEARRGTHTLKFTEVQYAIQ